MSSPYQNPNSTYYQTPNPNPSQQPEQYIQPGQPLPSTYTDPGQQAYSYYPASEGSLQPQPSGQRYGSHSPNVGNIPFPGPHYGDSASHQQTYLSPSQATPNLTIPSQNQLGRRGSHGHSPSGSYSDSASQQQTYLSPSQATPNLIMPSQNQHGRRGSHGHSPSGSYSDSASQQQTYLSPSQATPNLTMPSQNQHGRRGSHGHSPSGSYPDSASQQQTYLSPSQATPNLTIPSQNQHGRRGSHGHSPSESYSDSASQQQTYLSPSQATPNLTIPSQNQHGRRGSHGHSPSGSYSDSRGLYAAGASLDTGSGSNFYPTQPGAQPHHGGGYPATAPQPQAAYDDGQGSRSKAPPSRPADYSNRLCRLPHCTRVVLFDRRVNEYREWCSDQHMEAAIKHGVEKPCSSCRIYPRRNGHRHCSEVCRYRGH